MKILIHIELKSFVKIMEQCVKDLLTFSKSDLDIMALYFDVPVNTSKNQLANELAIKILRGDVIVEQIYKSSLIDSKEKNIDDFIKNRLVGDYIFLTIDGKDPKFISDTIQFPGLPSITSSYIDGWMCYLLGKNKCYSNEYTQNTFNNILQKLNEKANLSELLWNGFRGHYKIHLQPKFYKMADVILTVYGLWKSHKIDLIAIKFLYGNYAIQSVREDPPPLIVLYPLPGYEAAQNTVNILRNVLDSADGNGIKPRGNAKINNLIYVAGGDWSTKKRLEFRGMFDDNLVYYKGQKEII